VEGTPFGRYRLVGLLGRGGMGEVWQAFDTETRRTVAVKLLPTSMATDPVFAERFRREAEAAAGLNDPHVVPIHHFGEIDGRLYVDMRLIAGRDLDIVLAEGSLQPERAVSIVEQIASALQAAHRIGLIHRDVKPSNILLTDDDFAYLIDFGIARAAQDKPLTDTGTMIGTWAYMAPERFTTGASDTRGDVYALACVLYQCLTGLPPFPGNSLEQQFTSHMTTPPPRASEAGQHVPVELDDVIANGMAKDIAHRYQTPKDLAQAARAALDTPPPLTVPTMTPNHRSVSPCEHIQPVADSDLHHVPTRLAEHPTTRPPEELALAQPPARTWWRRPTILITTVVLVVAVIGFGLVTFFQRGRGSSSPSYGAQIALPLNGLSFPSGVAVDGSDNLYVADMDTGRVVKYFHGSHLETDLPFADLNLPPAVAVDDTGGVYVTDGGHNRVIKVVGHTGPQIALPFDGLLNPYGVAVDANGSVYVADAGNDRVLMLTAGGAQAVLPFSGLKNPAGVAVDSNGGVYVTDEANNRVLKLAGAGPQTVLPFGDLDHPEGVAVDSTGNVYITETGASREVLKLAAGSGERSTLPFTELVNPLGVAVDRAGNVYVADSNDELRVRRVLELPVA